MRSCRRQGECLWGVPAAPAGLSSRATEPMVSALRVSIPDACTLARAGDCKLPTPLRKTPWRRAPVLLRAWITCSLRRSNRRQRLRRHGSRSKSGLSSPRLRRRDGCFDKSVALHTTPICRKDWKPFAVLAHSFANISCGATLAPTCRAAGEKRTSHAKPPAADASDRGSARLRLRAGRTTRSLLSCLVPPSKRPSDRRGQGEAAPNRCKPQTKGQNHEHNKQPIHPANQHRRPSRHPRGTPTR